MIWFINIYFSQFIPKFSPIFLKRIEYNFLEKSDAPSSSPMSLSQATKTDDAIKYIYTTNNRIDYRGFKLGEVDFSIPFSY